MVKETNSLSEAGAISAECHRVMTSCFNLTPAGRPTAAALLADPWFTAGAPYPQPVRRAPRPRARGAAAAAGALTCGRVCVCACVRVSCCVRRSVRSRVHRRRCRRRRTWRVSSQSCTRRRDQSCGGGQRACTLGFNCALLYVFTCERMLRAVVAGACGARPRRAPDARARLTLRRRRQPARAMWHAARRRGASAVRHQSHDGTRASL
jgi:hypothetical protein